MNYGGLFETEKKSIRIQELEKEMNEPNFWNDKRHSEKVITEFNDLKSKIEKVTELKNKINDTLYIPQIDTKSKHFLDKIEKIGKTVSVQGVSAYA